MSEHCFICAGEDDNPDFDECGVCGRKASPAPYGASASNRAAETPLGRAIRLARGDIEPEDVPRIIEAWNRGLAASPPAESGAADGASTRHTLSATDTPQ